MSVHVFTIVAAASLLDNCTMEGDFSSVLTSSSISHEYFMDIIGDEPVSGYKLFMFLSTRYHAFILASNYTVF